MKIALAVLAVALTLGPVLDASGQGMTTGDLQAYCGRSIGDELKSHCYSYIDGFADALYVDGRPDKSVCIPQQANARQMAQVFTKWASENPQLHHLPSAQGLFLALLHAFPCRVAAP